MIDVGYKGEVDPELFDSLIIQDMFTTCAIDNGYDFSKIRKALKLNWGFSKLSQYSNSSIPENWNLTMTLKGEFKLNTDEYIEQTCAMICDLPNYSMWIKNQTSILVVFKNNIELKRIIKKCELLKMDIRFKLALSWWIQIRIGLLLVGKKEGNINSEINVVSLLEQLSAPEIIDNDSEDDSKETEVSSTISLNTTVSELQKTIFGFIKSEKTTKTKQKAS